MMATIEILPREVLLQIFSLLPYSDLVSIGRTCKHWHSLGKDYDLLQMIVKREFSWCDGDYYPTRREIGYAVFLENSGHLPQQILTSLAARITEHWNPTTESEMESWSSVAIPSLPQLACAGALASQGYISRVKVLTLLNVNISSVPAEDMASLVRCVSNRVRICSVRGDLTPVLSSVNCKEHIGWDGGLHMSSVTLNTDDTQSLVTAMVRGVKVVRMNGRVTLDMETLAKYDGKGECRMVRMYYDTRERYGDQVKAWARRIKWRMIEDDGYLDYEDDDFISIYG